jgi:multiple sugar transport system substrate-binding protein
MKYMAQKVREDAGTTYSFVYQGNQGEGGVVDALEHEWNAGATSSTERGSS